MHNKFLFTLFFCIYNLVSFAMADTLGKPVKNYLFNLRVDQAQDEADLLDRKKDNFLHLTSNEEINLQVTDAFFRQVDEMQVEIEIDKRIKSENEQKRSLRFLKDVINGFIYAYRTKQITASSAPQLIDNFKKIYNANLDSGSMVPFIQEAPYEIGRINAEIFNENIGYAESKKILFLKYSILNPSMILKTLGPYANESFADSLIVVACKYNPAEFYDNAQNRESVVAKLMKRSTNPLVKTVVQLSYKPTALFYFPFLDDLLTGKKNIDSLENIVGDGEIGYDSVAYYKLLVQTEIDYNKRCINKDTPIAMFGPNGLRAALKDKANRHFIKWINVLHEKPENVRMKAVDSLTSIDLYYLVVMGEEDIYTSSYKHSFSRLLQRLGKKPHTDSLLMEVNFDYFKKFTKMAANFNKLDTFLALMPPSRAETVMKAFVANLDKTNNLEDAVDVADAFSSINNKKLQQSILLYVKDNEQKCIEENSERGKTIYGLLKTIFLSADSINRIDLTSTIGIPSIYAIDNKELEDDSGRIVEQVFFYGDKDGIDFFPKFRNSFSSKEWKLTTKPEWLEIKSLKGKISIYANRPLDNDQNLDDSAQRHLNKFLAANDILPTIVMHRGHSYWLQRTLDRMPGDAKIVLLGSCGGYKFLNQIISDNPNAHVVSTKEIGKGDINTPILNIINKNLLTGKGVYWRKVWASLTQNFSKDPNKEVRESWEAYVPPYKNLGAIFIKAYNKKMEGE
jgi:hypothetical protein